MPNDVPSPESGPVQPTTSEPPEAASTSGAGAPPAPDVDLSSPSPFARAEAPPPVVVPDPAPKRPRGRPRKDGQPAGSVAAPAVVGPAIAPPAVDVAPNAANEVRKLFVDSKRAAGTLTLALDGALMALAARRYGPDAATRASITDAERKELSEAWEAFLKASNVQLSPGANLAIAIGSVYGTKAITLEMDRRNATSDA